MYNTLKHQTTRCKDAGYGVMYALKLGPAVHYKQNNTPHCAARKKKKKEVLVNNLQRIRHVYTLKPIHTFLRENF